MAATRSISELPGPPRLPLIGNAHQLRQTDRVHLTIEEWCSRYGPMIRFDLGKRANVAIGDAGQINAILRDRPEGFRRSGALAVALGKTAAQGVFVQEGDDWRRSRRLVVTALNSNHLQRYFDIVRIAGERLYRRMAVLAESGESFDPSEELSAYSLDIISSLAFGSDLNTIERRDSDLREHIVRHLRAVTRRLLAPIPYWRWVRLPADRAWERSVDELRRAAIGFIEQARARMEARPELRDQPENFLESMLAAEENFSTEEIVGNTFTLLLAGEDTTAQTMAWTLWQLATRPDIQSRWADEAAEVLGERRSVVEYETVEGLRYGEAVLRESMRLKPVGPLQGVQPLADVEIADTHIPAKTHIWLMMRHAGLSANGVEHARDLDPDRWLEEGDGSPPDQGSFLAFGAGPRFCPGRNLAFLEAKAGMAMIARNFAIELDDSAGPVEEEFSFTMVPRGLRVRLRKRNAST